MNVHIDRCLPNSGYSTPYFSSVTSLIVGPADKASVSSPLSTILLVEAAMVLRYTDLVELSEMILLALMLEILCVILQTAATSVEVPQPSHAGSGILVWVVMSAKPWGGVEDCTTANTLVGGNVSTVGAPGEWISGWVGTT